MPPVLTSLQLVRDRIKIFLDADADPPLEENEIDLLLVLSRRVDLFGNPPNFLEEWTPQSPYGVSDIVVPVGKTGDPAIPIKRNGFYYTVTVAGVSSSVEPTWPVVAGTIADGTITWTYSGTAPWNPTYDVNYAIAQGWLLKASRLVGHYNFMTGGKMLSREQFYEHCIKQYRLFSAKSGPKAFRLGMHEQLGLMMGSVQTNAD